jgi:hypothetical protein
LSNRSPRPQPRFEAAVVSLDAVVGVLVGSMPGRGQDFASTPGYTGAWSVTTSTGVTLVVPIALEGPVSSIGVPPHLGDQLRQPDRLQLEGKRARLHLRQLQQGVDQTGEAVDVASSPAR